MKRVWLVRLAAVLALYFALQGGEFSTIDLFRQRQRLQQLSQVADSLRRDVDSLRALRRAIEIDPAVQERIAREDFGMVREGELLFRFLDPDSLGRRRR
ncbi:MAG: septum formation initiator family protein [Gemmatimonadaceae bacterium]|nr:septum formation initiator family protein [Gemmatimonadaceae bacterium]